jgi:outer membrane protein insertion porin family
MKKFVLLLSLIILNTQILFADIVNNIDVKGNNRVSKNTIINFLEINIGDDINTQILNLSLKKLFETKFFENVDIDFQDNRLSITVKEHPIIQQIVFQGLKQQNLINEFKEILSLKEKNPYNKTEVTKDVNKILNSFKQSGYYFAKVDANIQEIDNTTVNLIYIIEKGERASISKIEFIGDKKFKNKKLNSVIVSEEDKFWKIISNKKYLNIDRINLDKRLLYNFYRNKGYYNVVIKDAYSKLIDNKNFLLTFNIDAGEKYNFGKLSLNLPDDYNLTKFKKLVKIFNKLEDTLFNYNKIEDILEEIEKLASEENYEFIDIDVTETVIQTNKVNFEFNVKESNNFYVNKINIFGNNITSEVFIRNNLIVDEGDPLNKILQKKSVNNLKSKGIFKSVNYNIIDTEDDLKKDIDIIIEEKPTGEISAGAGFGTEGSTFSVGIKENNFKGEGIALSTNLELGEDSIRGSIFYTHPNFAYSDRALTTSLESVTTDKLTDSGYKTSLNQISLGTRYEQFDDLFFSPSLSIANERLETTSSASAAYKKQEGSYFDTLFNYGITLDKRNMKFQPTEGYISRWSQNLPLISNNQSITNTYSITGYNELIDNMILSTGVLLRSVNTLENNKDVRVSKRLYLPSKRLRGFESGKVGPKDGDDYVGGNYVASFNTSTTVPFVLETMENVDLKLFLDVGNVWGVDYDNSIDESNVIRSSTGLALEIFSPVGPISFSYAEAISKASTDRTETFRFQLGTTF